MSGKRCKELPARQGCGAPAQEGDSRAESTRGEEFDCAFASQTPRPLLAARRGAISFACWSPFCLYQTSAGGRTYARELAGQFTFCSYEHFKK